MDSKEVPRRKLSRAARILGGVILVGAIGIGSQRGESDVNPVSAGLPPPPTPIPGTEIPQDLKDIVSPKPSEEEIQSITRLKDGIANEYGIYIQTFDEISKVPMAKLMYGFDNLWNPNQDWNEKNLELLKRTLNYLPKNLLAEKNGEKVHVILAPTSVCGWDAKTFTPPYPREIMISFRHFRPETPLSAAWVLAHESAHLRSLDSCSSLDPDAIKNSPYFKKVGEILGGSYIEVREEFSEKLADLEERTGIKARGGGMVRSLESIKTPEELNSFRFTRFKYGISKDMPTEFIAVAAESYFLGKDYFFKMYEPFFEKETIDELYKFVKEDIFDGREYPDYSETLEDLESKR